MRAATRTLPVILVIAGLSSAAADAPQPASGRRLALLVGCTRYDSLVARRQLRGPANDVVLMRRLLTERFGFDPADITVLAEQDHVDRAQRQQQQEPSIRCDLPTDEHIIREFERLICDARAGDTVFILLSGHGSRQPDQDNDPERDPEPDGFDELFLPCNIGRWQGDVGTVEHAITDDQIRDWSRALVERGAFVFFVADSCHSGTVTRGIEGDDAENYTQRSRETSPEELGIPEELAQRAASASAGSESDWFDAAARAGGSSGMVALYAVQAHQEAIEEPPTPSSPHFGRLSHTLYEVLSQCNQSITYRELTQRILWRFEQNNWISRSTPFAEGTAVDRTVFELEEWPGRSQITLHRAGDGLTVTSGALHGLTIGSILEVYPPAGESSEMQVLGHVRVTGLFPLSAKVEPIAWRDTPLVVELPDEARCQLVYRDLTADQLRVAIQVEGLSGPDAESAVAELRERLSVDDTETLPFRLVDGEVADWVAVIVEEGVYLQRVDSPRFDWSDQDALRAARRRGEVLGAPYRRDQSLAEALRHDLGRVGRADALRKLAEAPGASEDTSIDVAVQVVRDGRHFQEQDPEAVQVRRDERLRLQITNTGLEPAAVVVFYVASDYSIDLRFPRSRRDEQLNLMSPNSSLAREVRFDIDDATTGWEHVIIIAVGAQDQGAVAELMRLQQEAAAGARTRGAGEGFVSPLARLVDSALTGSRAARDPDAAPQAGTYAIRRVSWNVVMTN